MFARRRDPFASWFGAFFGAERVVWADVQGDVGRVGGSGRKKS